MTEDSYAWLQTDVPLSPIQASLRETGYDEFRDLDTSVWALRHHPVVHREIRDDRELGSLFTQLEQTVAAILTHYEGKRSRYVPISTTASTYAGH